jgi:hypothetical protein
MKPTENQFEKFQDEAPEWWNRPITHEDMLAEAAAREDEKDFPKIEVSSDFKDVKPPF